MSDLNTLKNRYFVQAGDANPPTEPVPQTFNDCRITPLIDLQAYGQALVDAFAMVTGPGDIVLIQGWLLALLGGRFVRDPSGLVGSTGPAVAEEVLEDFHLVGPYAGPPPVSASSKLIDLIEQKAIAGVDVRVMGFISFSLMGSVFGRIYGPQGIVALNSMTMKTIKRLRASRAHGVLNVISHSAGAAHTKMALFATSTQSVAFTGGIDFASDRRGRPPHTTLADEFWHDVQVKIEGPGVQAVYDWFKDMWNESLSRPAKRFLFEGEQLPSFKPQTPPLGVRNVGPAVIPASTAVQSLRTVPAFNYRWYNSLPENPPISFAPQGLFEFKTAFRKIVLAAQRFIYMEDQSFWSQEMMLWVRDAVRNNADVHVILLTVGRTDPNDPNFPAGILTQSINHGLLQDLDAGQRARIRLFRRANLVVHAKTTIVDDEVAIIGSSNCMRRSLYTDLEHAFSFVDPTDVVVPAYRKALWADHFNQPAASFFDIDQSLHAWDPAWGTAGLPFSRPAHLQIVPIPVAETALSDSEREHRDMYDDLDSRDSWGGICP